MVTNKTLREAGDWFFWLLLIYIFGKGFLSDIDMIEGFTEPQLRTFTWSTFAISIGLAWLLVLRPLIEGEKETPS